MGAVLIPLLTYKAIKERNTHVLIGVALYAAVYGTGTLIRIWVKPNASQRESQKPDESFS